MKNKKKFDDCACCDEEKGICEPCDCEDLTDVENE